MRTDDLSGGSLKALLILLLVAANIIAALPNERAWLQFPGSALPARLGAGASRAAFGASPNARTTSNAQELGESSARAPETARQARALPAQPPR